MFNTNGLTSLFGRLGKSTSNSFMPQEKYEIPQESFMPFPKEDDFKMYSSSDSGENTPVLTGGVEKTGGGGFPTTSGDILSGGIDVGTLTSLLAPVGNSLGSLMGSQQQTQPQQGNVYNQITPSPMLPQQMLPMMQNTFVPQTQMQNFQPYSLLNGNLG